MKESIIIKKVQNCTVKFESLMKTKFVAYRSLKKFLKMFVFKYFTQL